MTHFAQKCHKNHDNLQEKYNNIIYLILANHLEHSALWISFINGTGFEPIYG